MSFALVIYYQNNIPYYFIGVRVGQPVIHSNDKENNPINSPWTK